MSIRDSASLILQSPLKILMIKRRPRGTFGSFTVFPGGIVEGKDKHVNHDYSARLAAIRETVEETGLLLKGDTVISQKEFSSNMIDSDTINSLEKISTWITPSTEKIRFKTDFFLKSVQEIPYSTPDGYEAVEIYVKSITDLLLDFENGKIALMPPQWILLKILKGDIKREYFTGIIDPEFVYKSNEKFILVFPGDYQHSSTLKNSFTLSGSKLRKLRIIGRVENGKTVEYKLETD